MSGLLLVQPYSIRIGIGTIAGGVRFGRRVLRLLWLPSAPPGPSYFPASLLPSQPQGCLFVRESGRTSILASRRRRPGRRDGHARRCRGRRGASFEVDNADRYSFEQVDICSRDELKRVFSQ